MFLSSTALLPSVNRLLSDPNIIDWSYNHTQHTKVENGCNGVYKYDSSSQKSLSNLQVTLSSLVTDWTVKRVIGKKELHDSLSTGCNIKYFIIVEYFKQTLVNMAGKSIIIIPGLTCLLRVCKNVPSFHDRHSTCGHRLPVTNRRYF